MNNGFEEVRLSLPHIELAAHLYGPDDGLPVLALHGWLDNAASFARLAPKLEGVRIVALDFAGHGHSEHRSAGAGYALWDYAYDVLQVAEQFGWPRFSILGHSMGAITAVLLAGAMPERVARLALIDGLVPYTGEADQAPQKLGEALRARQALNDKRKPVYAEMARAVEARMKGVGAVSREAAELLAQRGLMPVPGVYLAHRQQPDPAVAVASELGACPGIRPRAAMPGQSGAGGAGHDGRAAGRAGIAEGTTVRGAPPSRRSPSASG